MMSELIMTSLFCDDNDFADGDFSFLHRMQQSLDDVTSVTSHVCDGKNSSEHLTSTGSTNERCSPEVPCVESGSHGPHKTTDQAVRFSIQPTDTHDSGLQELPPSCTGIVPDLQTCQEFWTRIMQASRVDLSTFSGVNPMDIFGNDYLSPVDTEEYCTREEVTDVEVLTTTSSDDVTRDTDLEASETELPKRANPVYRPPYTYAAVVVAAIYTSGKKSLTVDEIMNQLRTMFEEFNIINQRKLRKSVLKVLNTNKLFSKVIDNNRETYRVNAVTVQRTVFFRQRNKGGSVTNADRVKYATYIHIHLGLPTMLVDLGIKIQPEGPSDERNQRNRERKRKLQQDSDFEHMSSEGNSASAKRFCQSEDKRQGLEMPVRPCFLDDTDSCDADLTHFQKSSGRPECYTPSIDDTRRTPTENLSYTDSSTGIQSTCTAPSHHPIVVVSTPRYGVPLPQLFVPSQPFIITCTGSVELVDVIVNGHVYKVPAHQLYRLSVELSE